MVDATGRPLTRKTNTVNGEAANSDEVGVKVGSITHPDLI